MATIAIGDIHGNLAALEDLIGQIRGELQRDDVVVFLGEYIDRGPHSRGCVDAVLALQRESPAEVVCLRGNHEDWLLRTMNDYTRHSWLTGMEALDTIHSYSPEAAEILTEAAGAAGMLLVVGRRRLPYEHFFDVMPDDHQRFFRKLAYAYSNDHCVCTHAGVDPSVPRLGDQKPDVCIWGHDAFLAQYAGAIPAVYGHWNNAVLDAEGWPRPRIGANTIGLDTISHGVLSAIRLPDRTVLQSRRF
jgi:serine/threonine protein phosphatase 1